MVSSLVDLRMRATWSPVRILDGEFVWPTLRDSEVRPVGDIAVTVVAGAWVEEGTAVITPAGAGGLTGAVRRRTRRYRGAAYQVGAAGDIRAGDLLVPPNAEAQVIYVSGDLIGSLASSRFTALRADRGYSLWLWAILNSESGARYRAAFNAHVAGWPTSQIRRAVDMKVPIASPSRLAEALPALQSIETEAHHDDGPPDSWWRVADIRQADWNLMLATPDPDALTNGIPLGDLCTDVLLGRFDPAKDAASIEEMATAIPVTDIRALGGRPSQAWAALQHARVVAKPGDIMLAQHGERAYATVASSPTVAARHVYVLRLNNHILGPAVAAFLNSQTGLGLRRILSTGITIPNLSRKALQTLAIPESVLSGSEFGSEAPIAQRLEILLWS